MFRFDQLIRRDMIIRDVKQRHRQPHPSSITSISATLATTALSRRLARKNGLHIPDVVDALNRAAFGAQAESDEHASHQ